MKTEFSLHEVCYESVKIWKGTECENHMYIYDRRGVLAVQGSGHQMKVQFHKEFNSQLLFFVHSTNEIRSIKSLCSKFLLLLPNYIFEITSQKIKHTIFTYWNCSMRQQKSPIEFLSTAHDACIFANTPVFERRYFFIPSYVRLWKSVLASKETEFLIVRWVTRRCIKSKAGSKVKLGPKSQKG